MWMNARVCACVMGCYGINGLSGFSIAIIQNMNDSAARLPPAGWDLVDAI